MNHKGYLCEHCGQKPAKFEARSLLKGKNILVCSSCLDELNGNTLNSKLKDTSFLEWGPSMMKDAHL